MRQAIEGRSPTDCALDTCAELEKIVTENLAGNYKKEGLLVINKMLEDITADEIFYLNGYISRIERLYDKQLDEEERNQQRYEWSIYYRRQGLTF